MAKLNPIYAGWAVGTMGASLLLNTFSIAALFFLITVLQIDPLIAGVLITASKLYDAATDPIMGWVSDRTHSRWGRRRPYLLLGGLGCGISFAALFMMPPGSGSPMYYAAVAGLLILLSTAYTIFNVPYLAMPAEMIDDYHQRSVMMSYRVYLIALGTFAAVSGSPALIAFFRETLGQSMNEAYANMGLVIGTLIMVFMAASFFGTRNARATERVRTRVPLADRLRLLWGNRPFLMYLGIKLSGLLALASIIATQFFFVVYVLERSVGIAAFFGAAQLAGKLISIPTWLKVSRSKGKAWIVVASTLMFVPLAASWLVADASEPLWAYVTRGFFIGVAGAGTILGTQAMLPDIMEYDYRRTGMRREGIYAGVASFIEKTASAMAGIVIGGFLSVMQFDKALPPGSQPDSAIFAIIACTSLVPVAMYVVKLLCLWFYDLNEQKLKTTGAALVRSAP